MSRTGRQWLTLGVLSILLITMVSILIHSINISTTQSRTSKVFPVSQSIFPPAARLIDFKTRREHLGRDTDLMLKNTEIKNGDRPSKEVWHLKYEYPEKEKFIEYMENQLKIDNVKKNKTNLYTKLETEELTFIIYDSQFTAKSILIDLYLH